MPTRSVISRGEPLWLTIEEIVAIHDDQIASFGGSSGVRDIRLIESTLAVPRNLHHYRAENRLDVLAASLCIALGRNHGFVGGNKRVGAVSMIEFLALNGWWLDLLDDQADQPRLGVMVEAAILGRVSEGRLASALAENLHPIEGVLP